VAHYDTIAPYQAADVWMCGVVLFCLATGSFPWYGAGQCGACGPPTASVLALLGGQGM
jgi:hypothetical protein